MMKTVEEPTLQEIVEQYTAWCAFNTRPIHAAQMRLYYAQKLHHRATLALSAEQDRVAALNGGNNEQG